MKFREKPIVIDALLYDGANIAEVCAFSPSERWTQAMRTDGDRARGTPGYPRVHIQTPRQDDRWASPGDYIIRDAEGRFDICKPDIFAATYEPVEPASAGVAKETT